MKLSWLSFSTQKGMIQNVKLSSFVERGRGVLKFKKYETFMTKFLDTRELTISLRLSDLAVKLHE